MRIYRIEVARDDWRYGLYFGTNGHDDLFCDERCPSPFSAIHEPEIRKVYGENNGESHKWFFAFKNVKQLQDWITPDNEDLHDWLIKQNAFIVAYDVSEKAVVQGRKQVIFLKRYAQEAKATAFECAIEDMRIAV